MYRMAQQQLQNADAERPGFSTFRLPDYVGLGRMSRRPLEGSVAVILQAPTSSDYMRLWDHYGLTLGKAVALHHTGQQEESLRQVVLAHRRLQQDRVKTFRFFLRRNLMKQALAICRRDQSDTLVYVDGIIQPEDNGILDRDPARRSVAVQGSQSCFQSLCSQRRLRLMTHPLCKWKRS